ncbi:type III polyketide synthase [Mucilaginibacter conchicola]|uniref:Type III polyketide synthase n=1 Tax=Mucilaginibacter conchicola TaxID=2303333 RepID=A0A372NNW1_9SPHI|nr:3-oxoacyl-[acyl-carrier-protein] synthase III C-terminal domain-containing protein [Mucilaginibacter conchicola]RFZ90558.1 type III polyketide synthase [Mucilaginibacter conchicola]
MPYIAAVSGISLPHKVNQQDVKAQARALFAENVEHAERLLQAFDNTGIVTRNFAKPIEWYGNSSTFEERNSEYIKLALQYSEQAVKQLLAEAGIDKDALTDIIFVSTTGLATPSIDALLINKMQLPQHINRTPVWGLGCAGGVAGVAKASIVATANPDAVVLLVAVELCSLTLIKSDYSKSNFIGSSLFSDGVAACVIMGDNHASRQQIKIKAGSSKLYYDSLDVMGWDFNDDGFKVVFSKDIPTIINKYIKDDVEAFLQKQGLTLADINNFIFHPGGRKVIEAYTAALDITETDLQNTIDVMTQNGNMSSVTVLYVLERFLKQGFTNGYGLMLAMGPGFSSEMLLLEMKN